MKWIFLLLALLIPGLAFSQAYNAQSYTSGSFNPQGCGGKGGVCAADLQNLPVQINGTLTYCSDCMQDSTCSPGGSGSPAIMVNGVWNCGWESGTACGSGSFNNIGSLNAMIGPGNINIVGNTPNSNVTNVNVNGVINVKTYGATGNGTTDDSTAINTAVAAARTAGKPIYMPAGTYLVQAHDLNFTAAAGGTPGAAWSLTGDGPQNTQILCQDYNGNCIDASGSDGFNISGIELLGGTSAANAPKTLILLARVADDGWGHTLNNIWLSSYGPYTVYDYGAEVGNWIEVRSNSTGAVISACNSAGVTSAYRTLVTGFTSMSAVRIWGGNYDASGGVSHCAVTLDAGCSGGTVHDISFNGSFMGEFNGGGTAFCDTPGGTNNSILNLGLSDIYMEAADVVSTYKFLDLSHSYVLGLSMFNDRIGTTPLTIPALNFNYVDNSRIQLDGANEASSGTVLYALGGRSNDIKGILASQISSVLLGDPWANMVQSINGTTGAGTLQIGSSLRLCGASPSLAGGGYFGAGSNAFIGTIGNIAASGNVITTGCTCPNHPAGIIYDTQGNAITITGSTPTTITFSGTAAHNVSYVLNCN